MQQLYAEKVDSCSHGSPCHASGSVITLLNQNDWNDMAWFYNWEMIILLKIRTLIIV